MGWDGWPLERVVVFFIGLAFLALGLQVIFFHYRQNFRHWAMWIPVLATPVFGLVGLLISFYNTPVLRSLWLVLLAVGALAGILGFWLHLRGVGERVDGYKLNNFLIGPPIMLPLLITVMSVLGLAALYWR